VLIVVIGARVVVDVVGARVVVVVAGALVVVEVVVLVDGVGRFGSGVWWWCPCS